MQAALPMLARRVQTQEGQLKPRFNDLPWVAYTLLVPSAFVAMIVAIALPASLICLAAFGRSVSRR